MSWYTDDNFWVNFHDRLFSERRANEAENIVNGSELFRFPDDARILDFCCGPALFAAPLARRGYSVTGVDLSKSMLRRAEELCRETAVAVRLVNADARDFVETGSFDVVLNLFTSFGYFEEHVDNTVVLRNMYECLVPGGSLILDVRGKEIWARTVQQDFIQDDDASLTTKRDVAIEDWARIRSEWTSTSNGRTSREVVTLFVYSAVELRAMLEEVGFSEVKCFGDYFGAPYDGSATRLVVHAKRQTRRLR